MKLTVTAVVAATTLIGPMTTSSAPGHDPHGNDSYCQSIQGETIRLDDLAVERLDICADLTSTSVAFKDGSVIPLPPRGRSLIQHSLLMPGATEAHTIELTVSPTGEVVIVYLSNADSVISGSQHLSRVLSHDHRSSSASTDALLSPMSTPKCDSDKYKKYGWWQVSQHSYWINSSLSSAARDRIKAAALTIANATDDCGLPGTTGITSDYKGTTGLSGNFSSTGSCTAADGVSVVDIGTLPTGVRGKTCTDFSFLGWVLSSDVRMKSGLTWYTGSSASPSSCPSLSYDLQAIATHEFGHSFGLDHAPGNGPLTTSQTMYMETNYCSAYIHKRRLGAGDHAGLMDIY